MDIYQTADDIECVPLGYARAAVIQLGALTRNAVMEAAARVAPQVAAESDPRVVHDLIVAALQGGLDELADVLEKRGPLQ